MFINWLKRHQKITLGVGALIGIGLSASLTVKLAPQIGRTTSVINVAGATQLIEDSSWTESVAIHDRESVPDQIGILLLGYGGAGHQGGGLSDVIQVIYIDKTKEKTALISIPRDLWVKQNGGKESKINGAWVLGGNKNQITTQAQTAKQIVSQITGLPIHYFISVDFVGFERLIGQDLKGIEVNVSEPLVDSWYPIKGEELNTCGLTAEEVGELTAEYSGFELEKQFPCRYEKLNFQPGINKMQGGEALKFVRSRHGSNGGDFSRARRQHELLEAISKKLISLEAVKNVDKIYQTVTQNVNTDLDLEGVRRLAAALPSLPSFSLTRISLTTENVLSSGPSSSLIPRAGANNWVEIKSYIQAQLD